MMLTSRWTLLLARCARLAALALVMLGSSLGWLAHVAAARVDELLDDLDSAAMHYANARHAGPPQTMHLNGIVLRIRVGTTEDSVDAVLDYFHARCRRQAMQPDDELSGLARRIARPPADWLDGIARSQGGRSGRVACFDSGGARPGTRALVAQLSAFSEDLDAARFGVLRYVAAQRSVGHTTYVSITSRGPLTLSAAFAGDRDAPDTGSPTFPRPASSTRLLSAWLEDQSPSLQLYRARTSDARALLDGYRIALTRAGFSIIGASINTAHAATPSYALQARKAALQIDVRAAQGADGRALLSVISGP